MKELLTVAEDAPVMPTAAQLKHNMDVINDRVYGQKYTSTTKGPGLTSLYDNHSFF